MSVPKELESFVPDIAVPIAPIIEDAKPYSMFQDYGKYGWVLAPRVYSNSAHLINDVLGELVVAAEAKLKEIRR